MMFLCVLGVGATAVAAQDAEIKTEYLLTLHAPLDPPQQIDAALAVFNVREGGWAKGPALTGAFIAPAADWLRTMPDGSFRVDVRGTIKTDDGALIYLTYNGVISYPKASLERLMKGELLTSKDYYFVTAPTMQTSASRYAWLNNVQLVGKAVEVKLGENAHVTYDLFVVR
jgi:hypothetical protein